MRRSQNTWALIIVAVLCMAAGFVAGLLHAGTSPQQVAATLGLDAWPALADEAPAQPLEVSTAEQAGPASILLAGDVLPLDDRDYLSGVAPLIASADLAVCNLECPISSHGARTGLKLTESGRVMYNEYFFRAPPVQAQRLADAGFDGVTLANNHTMDYGGEALLETLSLLDAAGISHTGAGPDRVAAREPMIATVGGTSIAFLAYVDAGTLPGTETFAATDETAGTVFVSGDGSGRPDARSAQLIRNDIHAAGKQVELVIVAFHWGTEGADDPDPLQRNLAHFCIDEGAHAVIGHHPHRLQGVEIYRGRPIAYSLGNFAFPTPWESNQYSAALEVVIEDGQWARLVWHPVRIEHLTGDCAPARGPDAERIVARLKGLSEALGTPCRIDDVEPPRVLVDRASLPVDEETAPHAESAFSVAQHPDLEGMAVVSFLAWDLDGEQKVARDRTVVVNQKLADEVLAILREIYEDEEHFPIHEVIGYDYRTVAGSQDRLSYHALGRAIDINRAENPMIQGGRKIVHPDEPPYEPGEWRPGEDPYSIPAGGSVVEAFTSRGWRWGGTWQSCKDYQHFDRPN